MLHLSRQIEDAALSHAGITEMHVSFQSMQRFAPQIERYQQIASSVMGMWVYGNHDTSLPLLPRTAYVDTHATPMRDFWWMIASGPGLSLCLIAEEIPCMVNPLRSCASHQYRGFYTSLESTGREALDLLHEAFPQQVPQSVVRSLFIDYPRLQTVDTLVIAIERG
jgi:hypothetical protein